MKLLPDTRNVLATFAGIALVLYGARAAYGRVQDVGAIYRSQSDAAQTTLVAAQTELDTERAATADLRKQVETLTARQLELEQQLVDALNAAGLKDQADRVAAQEAQQRAQQAQQAAAEKAKLQEQQRIAAAQKAAADAAAAQAAADAKAAAEAKALADAKAAAQAAAQQNAVTPSRQTRAS